MLVVGSAKALATDTHWGALLRSATERRLMVKPSGARTAAAFDAFVAKPARRTADVGAATRTRAAESF